MKYAQLLSLQPCVWVCVCAHVCSLGHPQRDDGEEGRESRQEWNKKQPIVSCNSSSPSDINKQPDRVIPAEQVKVIPSQLCQSAISVSLQKTTRCHVLLLHEVRCKSREAQRDFSMFQKMRKVNQRCTKSNTGGKNVSQTFASTRLMRTRKQNQKPSGVFKKQYERWINERKKKKLLISDEPPRRRVRGRALRMNWTGLKFSPNDSPALIEWGNQLLWRPWPANQLASSAT